MLVMADTFLANPLLKMIFQVVLIVETIYHQSSILEEDKAQ
jgi:hypothetical protein